MSLARIAAALAAGSMFGFGLALSGMLDPARVRGFLDVFGAWDPSLAFVLAGAVAVASIGTWIRRRLTRPAFDRDFHLPRQTRIDSRLVTGAAIFGVGWGMAGLCPGPALTSLTLGLPPTVLFVLAMLAGMLAHDRLPRRSSS
ncbi:YeeE/YedE family protein [Geminicoccus roseus]|uniref:YeeE/YedE family protein n=1 Tax=Geminicoccus roseus TaxID=404900 RepID=UPI00041B0A52|nr:YeeE/YedE family protein [Geminicoccus roseus]